MRISKDMPTEIHLTTQYMNGFMEKECSYGNKVKCENEGRG